MYKQIYDEVFRFVEEETFYTDQSVSRSLNLCLVIAGIRPGTLWYHARGGRGPGDVFKDSKRVLKEVIDEHDLEDTIKFIQGSVSYYEGYKPQRATLIYRSDSEVAVAAAKSRSFKKNMFADPALLGKILGYSCDVEDFHDPELQARIIAISPDGYMSTVVEQLCSTQNFSGVVDLGRTIDEFCVENDIELGIVVGAVRFEDGEVLAGYGDIDEETAESLY